MNIDSGIMQTLGVLLAFAVLNGDWREAKMYLSEGESSFLKQTMWLFVVMLDDVFAAGLLMGVYEILNGTATFDTVWYLAPWLATTSLIIRTQGFSWRTMINKLADDLRDGTLIAVVWFAFGGGG